MHLVPIAPHSPSLYALLRAAHTWLAMLLFGLILMHLAAALFHLWVRRDHVFESMALWTSADARARIERRRKSILGGV